MGLYCNCHHTADLCYYSQNTTEVNITIMSRDKHLGVTHCPSLSLFPVLENGRSIGQCSPGEDNEKEKI